MLDKVSGLYGIYMKILDKLQSALLLAIRLYWGWQFAQTGWGKLHHIDKVSDYFASLGLFMPHEMAYFIALVELIGGILLAVGLGSRLIASVLTIDMIAAFWIADRNALFSIFKDPDTFYAAAPYTFLFASLIVLIFGPGRIAMDTLAAKCMPKRKSLSQAAA